MAQAGIVSLSRPDMTPGQTPFGIKTGKVIGTDWRDHTVDVMMQDGVTYLHVPIVEMWGGTDYGEWSSPQYQPLYVDDPTSPDINHDAAPGSLDDVTPGPTLKRDSYALLAMVEGYHSTPMCVGFFYPDVSQMMFDGLQKLTRHVGDSFSAVTLDGNHYVSFDATGSAISFNNGYYQAPIVQGNDFDKLSRPNAGGYNITFYIAATKSRVELNGKSGDILCETVGGGAIVIKSQSTVDISGAGAVTISGSPLTLNGLVGIYFQ